MTKPMRRAKAMSISVMPVMPSWWTSTATIGSAERDAGDDRRLRSGVVALDVGGRVGLGVAERLGLGEGVGVGRAGLGHAGEDVVGGAVDDAHHPGDALADQRLAQRADDRDAAGHRGLEEEVDAGRLGRLEQLGAGDGQQLLVAGDDGLAGLERREDQLPGGLDLPPMTSTTTSMSGSSTTDAASSVSSSGPMRRGARLGQVADRHPDHLEAQPGAGLDVVALHRDELDEGPAHVPAAEHAHADGHHGELTEVLVTGAIVGGCLRVPVTRTAVTRGGRCG